MMDYKGINSLARVMERRSNEREQSKPELFDFGTIQSDFSLLCDNYKIPLLSTNYSVLNYLTTEPQKLEPNDRVLIAWNGNEAVVLGRIKPGTELSA